MMELLKSAPTLIPLVKTPDGLHKYAAQALVAHAINGAEFSGASAGVFARTAANKAADLAAVVEAVPVEDLGAHLGASAFAAPRISSRLDLPKYRGALPLKDTATAAPATSTSRATQITPVVSPAVSSILPASPPTF